MSLDFPASPSDGDVFNGFIYNSTLGAWDVATSSGKFTVTASGSTAYVFNGSGTISDSNPTLYLTRGQTYDFDVDATGHPFYIKTVSGTGTGNAYSDGVTNNGTESGTVTFTVQMDAPDTLYYNCANHSAMAGTIYVLDSTLGLSDFSVTTNSAGTAALTYSNSTGVFTYTPPDLSGYLTSEVNDLTASVTWADVPSANITELAVTQHEAALSITSTQVTDFSEAVDDEVSTLLQAGLGVDLTYDDANNELTIDSNHVEVACTNNSGASISIGTPVYQTGTSGNNITIAPADADDSAKMPAIGLTASTIANGSDGTVVIMGVVNGLDTSTFTAGDVLYVGTTAGTLTTSPPTGESGLIQNFGRVLKVNASSGSIAVMGAGRANAVANLNDGNVFIGNASNQAEARALVEADISDLGTYLTSVTFSDIDSAAVLLSTETFADVDTQLMTAAAIDDRIESKGYITSYTVTQSDVTTHQAALSITESQISDLGSYLTSVALGDVSDVTITSASSGQVLKYNGTAWVNAADAGIALTDLSVTTNAAGTAALSYNNSTGAFSYTPPDLSSYLTSYTVTQSDVTAHQAALSITESQISDFGTYNNYTDSDVDTHLNTSTASTNEVLSWNGTDYDWVAQSGGGGGIALTDLSVTTNTAGTAALSYNNTTGVFSYTPPDLSSYLTSYTVTQSDVTAHQAALSITESQISDLGTYLTGITGQSIENLSDVSSMTPTDGQVLTWDNTNSYWYAADASGGGTYGDSSVDTHLNQSTAASNEILSWNGSDYEWIEQGIATVYSLTGTAIDPTNGGIQTKTISANTTFTETLASGESVVLMLEGAASYTITWPTITWVTSSGNSAPTLTAKDTLVLWKVSTTLYGAYVGSYA